MPEKMEKTSQNGGIGKILLAGLVGVLIGVGGTFLTLNGGQSGQGFIGKTSDSSLTKDIGYTTGDTTVMEPVKNQGDVGLTGDLSHVFISKNLVKLPAYNDITVEELSSLYVEYNALVKAFSLTQTDINEFAKLAFNSKTSPGMVNLAKLTKMELLTEEEIKALLGPVHPCCWTGQEKDELGFLSIPNLLELSKYTEADLATLAKMGLVFMPIEDVFSITKIKEADALRVINNDAIFKPAAK